MLKAAKSPGRRARRGGRTAAIVMLLAWLVAATSAATAGEPRQAGALACHLEGLAQPVRCGSVSRPLDPAHPDGVTIDVQYVVVPALARRPVPEPIFFIAGGPGQSAIGVAAQTFALFGRLHYRRDIVFVDLRGTGRSEPLDCPEADAADRPESSVDLQVAALLRCKETLRGRPALRAPGALGFFTTPLAVQDLEAVRRALGAERLDLVGVSYGTRVVLEYLRQAPSSVRRAVLDSVAPPDMALPQSADADSRAALEAVFDGCDTEPACRERFPALRREWQRLLQTLPHRVRMPDARSGVADDVVLTREAVLGAVRGALYSPAVAAALPAAVHDAAAGRFEGLSGLAALAGGRRGAGVASGLHFSVVCAEDMDPAAPSVAGSAQVPGLDFGAAPATLYRRVCAEWPRGTLPAAYHRVGLSRVPTLLLSGGLDPATPPRHAERTAKALGASAQLVVAPYAGHGVLASGCGPEVLFRFLDAPDATLAAGPVDADCLRRLPRPPAFLPMHRTPAP